MLIAVAGALNKKSDVKFCTIVGLSGVHYIIAFQLKLDVPSEKPRWCTYRSFRNFDVVNFNTDLASILSQLNSC